MRPHPWNVAIKLLIKLDLSRSVAASRRALANNARSDGDGCSGRPGQVWAGGVSRVNDTSSVDFGSLCMLIPPVNILASQPFCNIPSNREQAATPKRQRCHFNPSPWFTQKSKHAAAPGGSDISVLPPWGGGGGGGTRPVDSIQTFYLRLIIFCNLSVLRLSASTFDKHQAATCPPRHTLVYHRYCYQFIPLCPAQRQHVY